MKGLSVFIFGCLLFGDAFGYASPERAGLTPAETAAIEQDIMDKVCPMAQQVEDQSLSSGGYVDIEEDGPVSCKLSYSLSDIEWGKNYSFACRNDETWTYHVISCSSEQKKDTFMCTEKEEERDAKLQELKDDNYNCASTTCEEEDAMNCPVAGVVEYYTCFPDRTMNEDGESFLLHFAESCEHSSTEG
ncbi:MAG: hypothetical protein OXB84_07895 [Halobacteriovoraceae bacterium]|nr:hypothetical protein [Halobacteriovoraceae bacterium]